MKNVGSGEMHVVVTVETEALNETKALDEIVAEGDGHRPVQLDDWARLVAQEERVEGCDLPPVGVRSGGSPSVKSCVSETALCPPAARPRRSACE